MTSPPRMTTASGYSISWPGLLPLIDERHQGQAGGQGGHQDRREPFFGTAQHQLHAERLALVFLQVAVVADQHDAVAGGDAQHRDEADQRAERQHAPLQDGRPARRRPARTEASESTSSVSRHDRKSTCKSSRIPRTERPVSASSRRCDSCRAAYSPRNSGWYSLANVSCLTRASISRATEPRSRPCTLQVMSSRREADSRLISFGAGTTRRRPRPRAAPGRPAAGRWAAAGSPPGRCGRAASPQTTTSNVFWSS